MGDTRIRWATKSWNPSSGCTKLSPGCDNCYAFDLAERRRGTPAFPVGFDPVEKPHKINEVDKWDPSDIFVNSMSDLHHRAFSDDFRDLVYDKMVAVTKHVYIVLTKRPKLMRDYLIGTERTAGYLARRGLSEVPDHIWLGVTIESDTFTWRNDVLHDIPHAGPITISAEPLLGPLPSLVLRGDEWLIAGGESGPKWKDRIMDHAWAFQLRDKANDAGVPFFFKQSSAYYTEAGQLLGGTERWEERPAGSRWRPPPERRGWSGQASLFGGAV